ncbi:hypothetical protein HY68_21350 [Streptomyces sp. AcH 505]|nr:hypothetical protein HY68_21350 [Streptomyces sp. AcH 505]
MAELWDPAAAGVLRLPSGRLVRGRGLRRAMPAGAVPAFGVYLLGKPPPEVPWESRWLRWPDFRLPADRERAVALFADVWERAASERVEVACGGGRGRTGTALACLAVSTASPRTGPWRMCGGITKRAPWRRRGNGVTSRASVSRPSRQRLCRPPVATALRRVVPNMMAAPSASAAAPPIV